MRLASAMFSLSLVPFSLSAQTATLQQTAVPVMVWSKVSGCPVSLRAQQISSADMMQVRKGQPQNSGQRLHLTFTDRDSRKITAATVAVQGFTFTPRMMNTGSADLTAHKLRPGEEPQKDSSLATRTIHIAFQGDTSVAADILVPGVSATQTIDLVALTYADGTEWKLAEGQSCRVTPDPMMLISAQ